MYKVSLLYSLLCGTVTRGLDYMLKACLTGAGCREVLSGVDVELWVKEHSLVLGKGDLQHLATHPEHTHPLNWVPQVLKRLVLHCFGFPYFFQTQLCE